MTKSNAAAQMPAHARHTVLIVEDNTVLRDKYWTHLQEANYRGVTAHNGKVLDVMYGENVSVVLLDLFKPESDGIETLKTIKRVSPETLVVAIGEDSRQLDVATQLGVDAFILKPAPPASVIEAVAKLTSNGAVVSQTDRRRYTRLAVDLKGQLYNSPDGQPRACHVVDMSAGGALIRSDAKCPHGHALVLQVEGFGSFEGVVVRSSTGAMGFKFLMGELKRDRLKHALASFAKTGAAPIGTYGVHPNFKPGAAKAKERREEPRKDVFPYS
ncbi:MAG TPA: response regulator [Rhizomicrobium sp.]|nr:response regulator [Rhizomicrobium sp.]